MSQPCNVCTKTSDNKYSNCPPHMADGRMFTDYRPRCIANFAVAGGANVEGNFDLPSSYEYRQYLIKNGSEIMAKNRQTAYQNNSCGPCTNPYNEGTMLPEKNMIKCDAQKCSFYSNDASGLGLGRQYDTENNTATRNRFIKIKEQEQAQIATSENCCWTASDDKNYFSFDYNINNNNNNNKNEQRNTVPGGASPFDMGNRYASV